MAIQRTFSIIKPDATRRNLTGAIAKKFEDAGLRIVASKRIHLTKAQAGEFYKVHAARPFYDELCEFMASAPIVCQVLEGENAVQRNRDIMGAMRCQRQVEGLSEMRDFHEGRNATTVCDVRLGKCDAA